jgi:hypothetical protein
MRWLFAIVILLSTAGAASAWPPGQTYIARTEKIVLADGTAAKIQMLVNDGLFSDSVRIVVVGADGRALARSYQSRTIMLLCDRSRPICKGYDRDTLSVLKPEPSSFRRDGPIMDSALENDDGDPRWIAEGGKTTWGFIQRPAPLPMIVTALVMETDKMFPFVGLIIIALVSGIATLVARLNPIKSQQWRVAVSFAQLIASVFAVGLTALCLVAGYAIGDMSIPLISVSFLAGISISIAGLWFWCRVTSFRRKAIAA